MESIQKKEEDGGKEGVMLTEVDSEDGRGKRRLLSRMKNETKNIPKNFGKGIISFIEKNEWKIRPLLVRNGVNVGEFIVKMRMEKKTINTIADLRRLWTH
ncbi:unnamed protein product [Sphagnum balticum]